MRETANIYGDTDDYVLCSDCVKRFSHINTAFFDYDDKSLSETSGIGSECHSEEEADDDDINQLRILVELTTGKRIYPVSDHLPESGVNSNNDKLKRRKRKLKKVMKLKRTKTSVEPSVDKRTAKISEKFKEIEIQSSKSSSRKMNNKSAKF